MKNKEAFEVLQIIFPRGYDLDARLVEAVQKHLKLSQQQLLERLSEGIKKEKIQLLDEMDRNIWSQFDMFNQALDKVEALIQEEKANL